MRITYTIYGWNYTNYVICFWAITFIRCFQQRVYRDKQDNIDVRKIRYRKKLFSLYGRNLPFCRHVHKLTMTFASCWPRNNAISRSLGALTFTTKWGMITTKWPRFILPTPALISGWHLESWLLRGKWDWKYSFFPYKIYGSLYFVVVFLFEVLSWLANLTLFLRFSSLALLES